MAQVLITILLLLCAFVTFGTYRMLTKIIDLIKIAPDLGNKVFACTAIIFFSFIYVIAISVYVSLIHGLFLKLV